MEDKKIIASIGSPAAIGVPVIEIARKEVPPEAIAKPNVVYESHHDLRPSPRPLTEREAAAVLPGLVRILAIEHPELKIIHARIEGKGQQFLIVQSVLVPSSPLPPIPVGAVLKWIAIAVIAAVAIAVVGVVVSPLFKVAYEIATLEVPKPVTWIIFLALLGLGVFVIYKIVKK